MGPAAIDKRTSVYRMELSEAISERKAVDVETVDDIILGFLDEITDRLAAGDTVILRGFGVFEARRMRPVTRRKPDSGEPVEVPAKLRPAFRASKPFKQRINGEAVESD